MIIIIIMKFYCFYLSCNVAATHRHQQPDVFITAHCVVCSVKKTSLVFIEKQDQLFVQYHRLRATVVTMTSKSIGKRGFLPQ